MTTHTEKILVADDDLFNRTLLVTTLEKQGYAVEIAENGRQGLEALHAGAFNLVLLDLLMQEMDGFEMLKWMNRRTHSSRNLSCWQAANMGACCSILSRGTSP
jgi:CheY-like chemotaxis protein